MKLYRALLRVLSRLLPKPWAVCPVVIESLESRTLLSASAAAVTQTTLFADEFKTGRFVDTARWHQPTWTGNGDGTYLGRTQLTVTQDNMPIRLNCGAALMTMNKFTPTMLPGQPAFHGTQITTNDTFQLGADNSTVTFEWRAKLNPTVRGGYVLGLFLYYINSDGTHNEIDFELVSNKSVNGTQLVNTNVYSNEPLGIGTPEFVAIPNRGRLTGYHTYTIVVSPTSVTWLIDKKVVRTETDKVPTGPVAAVINMWGADQTWQEAFNPALNPVSTRAADWRFTASVDYFKVTRATPPAPVFNAVSAAVQVGPAAVAPNDMVTANGAIQGVGSGNVGYVWMVQKPDGSQVQVGSTLDTTMANGTARHPGLFRPAHGCRRQLRRLGSRYQPRRGLQQFLLCVQCRHSVHHHRCLRGQCDRFGESGRCDHRQRHRRRNGGWRGQLRLDGSGRQ